MLIYQNKNQSFDWYLFWCGLRDSPTYGGPETSSLKTSFQEKVSLRNADWHFSLSPSEVENLKVN